MCRGSGDASAGRLRCSDVCDISLTLRRAACAAPLRESLSDFAGAKSREDEGEVYIEGKIISNLLMN